MPNSAFSVETNLIDRNDLNIYEKMCSVVLARYAGRAEFSNMLNINVIAIRMGCNIKEAEKALNSLIEKKLVTLEDAGNIEPELLMVEPQKLSSRVIKSERRTETRDVTSKPLEKLDFENFEHFDDESINQDEPRMLETFEEPVETEKEKTKPKRKTAAKKTKNSSEKKEPEKPARPIVPKQVREGVQDLIDQVFDIIDENINDREARIILSFANNDIEQVKEKYKIAKNSQVNDKIEMLINELQKREPSSTSRMQGESTGAKAKLVPEENTKILKNKQIDLDNINRMVAQKQNSYGKQNYKK